MALRPSAASIASKLLIPVGIGITSFPSFAQIPWEYPVVGLSAPSSCELEASVCILPYAADALGTYDVWIAPILAGTALAVRFGVTWPSEWQLVEVEVCRGTIVAGGIEGPGTGVTIELPWDPKIPSVRPMLRLRVAATVPGRLALIPDPSTAFFGYREPSRGWVPYDYYSPRDIPDVFYVRIGPQPCSIERQPLQCNFCKFSEGHAGSIDVPPRIVLPGPMVLVDTLNAYSDICIYLPECATPIPEPCFDTAWADVPWLTFEGLGGGDQGPLQLVMVVDARELPTGTHHACITTGQWSFCCLAIHYPLEVEVGPVVAEPTTWGALKHTYRH